MLDLHYSSLKKSKCPVQRQYRIFSLFGFACMDASFTPKDGLIKNRFVKSPMNRLEPDSALWLSEGSFMQKKYLQVYNVKKTRDFIIGQIVHIHLS